MKVFISWSGKASQEMAHRLHYWLPFIVPNIEPWMSEVDIAKGAPWPVALTHELAGTGQGVVCVCPDNIKAPWLNYEVGALSKAVEDRAYVRPVLLGLSHADLTGPLTLFQSTIVTDKADMFRLVKSLNEVTEGPHPDDRLYRVFDTFWPEFAGHIEAVMSGTTEARPPRRDERELLEEILTLVRSLSLESSSRAVSAALRQSFPRMSSVEAVPDTSTTKQ